MEIDSISSKPKSPSTNPRPNLFSQTPPRPLPSSSFSSFSPSSRVIYSDRFIPSRIGSNFALFDLASPSPSSSSSSGGGDGGKGDGSGTYSALLRSVLFGLDHVPSPATPDRSVSFGGRSSASSSPSSSSSPFSTPSRNIFRFKAEVRRYSSSSPVGFEDALPGVVHSQPKAPRKVPRSPYKVGGAL